MLLYALLQMMPAGSRTRWMGRDAHRPLKNNDSARIAPLPKTCQRFAMRLRFLLPAVGWRKIAHRLVRVCICVCVCVCGIMSVPLVHMCVSVERWLPYDSPRVY